MGCGFSFRPTPRMSHEEERVNGSRMRKKAERAPPHWLNPLGSRLFWRATFRCTADTTVHAIANVAQMQTNRQRMVSHKIPLAGEAVLRNWLSICARE